MPRLTKKFIESLPSLEKGQTIYRDDQLSGFGLRVTANCKSFVVERQVKGVRRRVTIGHTATMSLETARKEAERILAEMAQGIHPNDRRDDPTLREVMHKFLEVRTLSPKSQDLYRRIISRSLPDWLDLPITSITKKMIQERHHALVKPTHKGTENKSDADRTFHTLRVMMNFARSEYEVNGKSILEVNPIRDALHWRWHGNNVRTGVIPDHKLAEFYSAVMAQPNKAARDFIFLLLFTSLRRNEVSSLRWGNIDFEQRTMTIPAGYNKSKRDHILPLTEMVTAILESRKALRLESEFVLPASEDTHYKTGHLCEPRAVLLRIRKQIGIEWIWHDLRRTALSACEKSGIPYLAIQRIANHKIRRDITDRYLVIDENYVRPYLEEMNDRLLSLMGTSVQEWKLADLQAGVKEPNYFARKHSTRVIELAAQEKEEEEFYW